MMEACTLPSKAQVKSHGSLLKELRSDVVTPQNVEDSAELYQQLEDHLTSFASKVVVTKPNVPMESFVGLKEIKRDILSYLKMSGDSEDSFNGDVNFAYNDRVLFFGETGTGKAHLTRAIATTINANLIEFTNTFFLSKWDSKLDLFTKTLYDISQKYESGTFIVFFNHLDVFCVNEEQARTMAHFIRTLQSTWEKMDNESLPKRTSRLIIFASTNKPNIFDEKLVNCFDRRVYIPTLNLQERKQLFQRTIQKIWKLGHAMTPKDVDLVARKTYGILTSEIEVVVDRATHVQYPNWPSKLSAEEYHNMLGVAWRPLEQADFIEALNCNGFRVLDSKSFFEFETFHHRFGNGGHFQRMHEREYYNQDTPAMKGNKKHGWVYKLVSLF